eukprot:2249208-Amphidinium_carterae.1
MQVSAGQWSWLPPRAPASPSSQAALLFDAPQLQVHYSLTHCTTTECSKPCEAPKPLLHWWNKGPPIPALACPLQLAQWQQDHPWALSIIKGTQITLSGPSSHTRTTCDRRFTG